MVSSVGTAARLGVSSVFRLLVLRGTGWTGDLGLNSSQRSGCPDHRGRSDPGGLHNSSLSPTNGLQPIPEPEQTGGKEQTERISGPELRAVHAHSAQSRSQTPPADLQAEQFRPSVMQSAVNTESAPAHSTFQRCRMINEDGLLVQKLHYRLIEREFSPPICWSQSPSAQTERE
ncbi:hypothetical protein FQA47_003467 [Oryzias melastigma]|uniref:Uncharacterized protein n=1 Tax=Oryzias melastigma TaxID=30732 RepID=A0A834BT77_ORYME|nr:hypothetical protein FQA47_003467 [Oryzias melastigma]